MIRHRFLLLRFVQTGGKESCLHISNYKSVIEGDENAEKLLIKDILFYFKQFPLTFGWYTTGVAVYDEKGNRVKGRDSDFFILHQRCLYYNLDSPFEIGYNGNYITIRKDYNEIKHIDLIKVFEKSVIKDNVFEGNYKTAALDSVSSSLLHITKFDGIDAGKIRVVEIPLEDQKKYVKRDAELVMLLAQYNNCLVLRLMKVFSKYSELDYYKTCNTNVSKWYETKYKKMVDRGEVSLDYTSDYKLAKQQIGGGHHTIPKKGFFINSKIYELDVKGMYPTIIINNNISFDTINCKCCEYDLDARISQDTIDIINQHLSDNKIDRKVARYWICRKREGAFPLVIKQVLADKEKYLNLLKEEKSKINSNQILMEEYQTHQIGAKLFANAGFGLFGNEYFDFSNYRVAELITAEGRRIHKKMEQMAQQSPFNFEIVFGFTDSIFVNVDKNSEKEDEEIIKQFIFKCKQDMGIAVEIKNVFQNSIVYGKKNRFVGWTGKDQENPLIKGLDGIADSNPLWIRKWFYEIIAEIIRQPDYRFENVPKVLSKAIFDLENIICKSTDRIENELKFSQKLKKYPQEYKKGVRAGVLGKILGKDKGEEIYWYEITSIDKKTNGNFSTIISNPEDLNIQYYKKMLSDKVKDTLEITGLDNVSLSYFTLNKTITLDSFS